TDLLRTVGSYCRELDEAAQRGEQVVGLLYYAGHGIQVDGENYLLPTDVNIANKLDLRSQCVELDIVMEAMGGAARTSLIILDCCRNNPLPRTLGAGGYRGLRMDHGLANVHAPKGVYVAFATQPNFVALDGEGPNSPFTAALLAHIDDPEIQVSEVMMRVRLQVYEATKGEQIPWDHSALFEPFVFRSADPDAPPPDISPEALARLRRDQEKAREESYWEAVRRTTNVRFLQSFLIQFPSSAHREAALARIDKLRALTYWRKLAWRGAAAIAVLAVAYLGVNWMRYTTIAEASIVGGDIEGDDWRERSSYPWCKLRCVVMSNCIAFSYEPSRGRCSLKSEAAFYERSRARQGQTPEFSEIAYGYTPPKLSRFRLHWARALTGTPVPRAAIEAIPGLKDKFRADRRSDEDYLQLSSLQCQQACETLGSACTGFSHTRWGGGCELFSQVTGFFIDPRNNRPLFSPATIAGCNEPAIEDCRPRTEAGPAAATTKVNRPTPAPASTASGTPTPAESTPPQ
ncbi:MAG: caspase family protein, partial [Hyphomicrobiaceae bacterium]